MPYVNQPYVVTYEMRDITGSEGSCRFYLPATTLLDAAQTAAGGLRAAVEALSGAVVISQSLSVRQKNTTVGSPATGSRVENRGVFQFMTDAGKEVEYTIPSIIQAVILDDSGKIDEDNPLVAAFVTALTATDALFTDSNGVDLESLIGAWQRFNSTKKRQLPGNRRKDPDVIPGNG